MAEQRQPVGDPADVGVAETRQRSTPVFASPLVTNAIRPPSRRMPPTRWVISRAPSSGSRKVTTSPIPIAVAGVRRATTRSPAAIAGSMLPESTL
ncbi:MAG: hypothetical protein WD399_11975 [Thermoleophilaceae bacterium]